MQLRTKVLISWLAFAGTIAMNAMANILPINGLNTGQVSALYPNTFVPDGFTFSIWSVIYGWLLAYVIYSTVLAWSAKADAATLQMADSISPLFWITCVLNAAWIVAWHYLQLTLSLGIMILLLVTLIAIFARTVPEQQSISTAGRWLMVVPFVIYLAWICVATIANTTALLVDARWSALGLAAGTWSSAMVGVALLLTLWMVFRWKQAAFALVVAWACWGIYRGQIVNSPDTATTAMAAAALCLLAVFFWLRTPPAAPGH
jgi:translocator protein